MTRAVTMVAATPLIFALAACGGSADDDAIGEEVVSGPRVAFASPADGAAVGGPFEVCLEVAEFTIEAAGEAQAGAGHHHILVDPSADEVAQIMSGEPIVIAKDETHIHIGDGSACTMVEATAGEHTVMAVVADGAHTNLNPPLTAQISVTVAAE